MRPFPLTPEIHFLSKLALDKHPSKIVLFIMDGVGDLPDFNTGKTPLESARTPTMDKLAKEGALGLLDPISTGITPGSGPAHLSLFGYDPVFYEVGRGVLSVFGVRYLDKTPMSAGQLGARINFATVKRQGKDLSIADRRAGRIQDAPAKEIVAELQRAYAKSPAPGVKVEIFHEKEHRCAMLLSGKGLAPGVCDTDPQVTGKPPIKPQPEPEAANKTGAARTAKALAAIIDKTAKVLIDQPSANYILVRGVDAYRPLPQLPEFTKMRCLGVASYPMYRGVARLAGMHVPDSGDTLETQLDTLKKHWNDFDYFFFHVKKTDSAGEDGNLQKKIEVIEKADEIVAGIMELGPDVLAVTADHSTPVLMKAHSFHPVPLLLWGKLIRRDAAASFGETACASGGLGRMPSKQLLPLLMANAGKLAKYGA